MTRRTVFFWWALAVVTSISYAGPFKATNLRSCVGHEYAQLKPAPASQVDSASVCLEQGSMTVCRRKLRGDQDNDTTETTVSLSNVVIAQWREHGDPVYMGHLFAFQSNRHHPKVLVIAALQSESQGMGVQEWAVHVVQFANGVQATKRTLTTADFGVNGSLLRANGRSAGDSCHLLVTRWDERATRQGKRLFLVGELVDLLKEQSKPDQLNVFARRFDRKLEKLRLSDRNDRPLAFFQK